MLKVINVNLTCGNLFSFVFLSSAKQTAARAASEVVQRGKALE